MDRNCLQKFKIYILIFTLLFILPKNIYAKSVFFNIIKGNKEFAKKRYSNAQKIFQNALIDQPLNEIIHFNLGNVYYKMKKYDKAQKEYEEILKSKNNKLKEQAYYNIGNSHYRMGNYLEAINNYEKALEIDPNDKMAKENLELVRKKLKHMLKRQKEKEKSGQCPKKKRGMKGEEQKKQGAGKKKENEKKPGEKQKEGKKPQNERGGKKREDKDKLSDDEARRILQKALEDEVDKKQVPLGMPGEYEVYKDW